MTDATCKNLILLTCNVIAGAALPENFSISEAEALEIYKLAKKHSVANIIYHALASNNLIDESSANFKKLEQEYLKSIRRCARQDSVLAQIEKLYEDEGIDFIPLKGSEIKNYYPERWMRTSNDIDILVRAEDYDKACNALPKKLGYKVTEVLGYHTAFETDNKVEIEIHNKLSDEYIYDFSVKELTDDTWEIVDRAYKIDAQQDAQSDNPQEIATHCYKLRDDYFYLYNILHMMRHFSEGGCGVRFYIDLWILNNKNFYPLTDEMQTARDALLEKYNSKTFERTSLSLASKWFGDSILAVDKPTNKPGAEDLCEKEFELLEKFVFNAGTFGTLETRVKLNTNKNGGKAGYLLSRIFVSRDYLKLLYPQVEKRPYLTPIYEVRRWGRAIFAKDSRAGDEIKLASRESATTDAHNLSDEEIAKIKNLVGL